MIRFVVNGTVYCIGLTTMAAVLVSSGYNYFHATEFVFAHGLGGNSLQADYYKNHRMFSSSYTTFSFPDAADGHFNARESSLGQDNEVECLHTICEKTKETKASNLILYGVSRGASTIINYMGKHNPSYVKALILESPFDCVENVVHSTIKPIGLGWLPSSAHHGFAETFYGKYKRDGMHPIDMITKITNKDLPILFICSKKDDLVPCSSTQALYYKCKELGFTNAYILVLKSGQHAHFLENSKSHDIYQNTVHAFYKKFKLPYTTAYVPSDEAILTRCQP
jgi:alpha-beta hydrolase superfamily lysophospholipase